jgi:hypothetical protein
LKRSGGDRKWREFLGLLLGLHRVEKVFYLLQLLFFNLIFEVKLLDLLLDSLLGHYLWIHAFLELIVEIWE